MNATIAILVMPGSLLSRDGKPPRARQVGEGGGFSSSITLSSAPTLLAAATPAPVAASSAAPLAGTFAIATSSAPIAAGAPTSSAPIAAGASASSAPIAAGAPTSIVGASGTPAPSAGGAVSISQSEFNNAVTGAGFPAPSADVYNGFTAGLGKSLISSKQEAAMFLGQVLHESGGLKYTAELQCQSNAASCAAQYPSSQGGLPGKVYYGRGYIQLTWDYNYKAASEALYQNDSLLQNPDQVATNTTIAWAVSFWFWDQNVHNAPGVQQGQYGAATNAINGALECGGKNPAEVAARNANYAACLKAFGITTPPNTAGC
jgi:chitinase